MSSCDKITSIRKDELDVPDICDAGLLADWKQFEDDFGNPNDEEHPWKLKYLVALAFCKGWEFSYKRCVARVDCPLANLPDEA
tara:strand:+ start:1359 stop:1607 length:249 start_codon:yes stop_codon:yes gene_type:complete